MKKTISLFLALCMALSLCTTAFAAEGKEAKAVKQSVAALTAEKKDAKPPKAPKQETVRPTEPRPNAPEVNVTPEEAEQAALDAAGLARSEVKWLHSYKLYDRGNAYAYRVEFGVYNRETRTSAVYSYNVDITTGEIAAGETA